MESSTNDDTENTDTIETHTSIIISPISGNLNSKIKTKLAKNINATAVLIPISSFYVSPNILISIYPYYDPKYTKHIANNKSNIIGKADL